MKRLLLSLLFVLWPVFAVAVEPETNEEQQVQAYIAQQKAAGVPPKPNSAHWKPGYTCNDLKQYSFEEYKECRYYYAVHGRFYPG